MVVLASTIAAMLTRSQARDQSYQGIPVGELPPPGASTAVQFVDRIAVPERPRPIPPDDLSPALTGVVVDGRADPIEVAATLIDLAGRGRLTITERPAGPDSELSSDWLFSRVGPGPEPTEDESVEHVPASADDALLEVLFAERGEVALSELSLDQRRELNQVTDQLLREAERRRWFRRLTHSADTSLRLAGPVLLLLGAVAIVMLGLPWFGAGLMVSGVIFWVLTQGLPNPPVTADGLRAAGPGHRLPELAEPGGGRHPGGGSGRGAGGLSALCHGAGTPSSRGGPVWLRPPGRPHRTVSAG